MPKPLKITLIVLGVILLVIGGFVALVAGYIYSAEPLPVEESDYALLVRAEDLSIYFDGVVPAPGAETIEKQRYIDGSVELDLEYDVPDDENEPYIHCMISFEGSLADATDTMNIALEVVPVSMRLIDSNIDFDDRNDAVSFADESHFALITYEGETTGMMLTIRQGTVVFDLLMMGLYIDDPELLHELIDPRLELLKTVELP